MRKSTRSYLQLGSAFVVFQPLKHTGQIRLCTRHLRAHQPKNLQKRNPSKQSLMKESSLYLGESSLCQRKELDGLMKQFEQVAES